MGTELQLGSTIKKIRTEKNITLKELSQKANVTSSMLSQIERNIANPSLNTIKTIAQVLEVPLFKFFLEEDEEQESLTILKKNNRKHMYAPGAQYELLSPTTGSQIEFMRMALEEGVSSSVAPKSHRGEEVAVVIEGTMQIQIGEKKGIMEKGDSIYIPAKQKHMWTNVGSGTGAIVFAVTPPEF